MSSEDRTCEFMMLAQGFMSGPASAQATQKQREREALLAQPASSSGATGRIGVLNDKNPHSELKDFHQTASSISLDIASTSSMLSELAHLVRHQSHNLFSTNGGGGAGSNASNQQHARMNELVIEIKRHIESLNVRLERAQEDLQQKKKRMSRNSQAGQEASNLVGQLQLEFVKATQSFKDVLQQRSDGLKDVEDRKLAMLGANTQKSDPYGASGAAPLASTQSATMVHRPPVFGSDAKALSGMNQRMPMLDLSSAYKPETSAGESTSSSSHYLPRPLGVQQDTTYFTPAASGLRARHTSGSSMYPTPYGQSQGMLTPVQLMQMEQQSGQAQQMQLIPDRSYVRDRADAMSTVESNIVELGTIFNKLAVMVNEHKDLVQRVEDNVEDANANLELSMNALTDTLDHLRSNQGVFLKVTGILVIFIILFITFFA